MQEFTNTFLSLFELDRTKYHDFIIVIKFDTINIDYY